MRKQSIKSTSVVVDATTSTGIDFIPAQAKDSPNNSDGFISVTIFAQFVQHQKEQYQYILQVLLLL